MSAPVVHPGASSQSGQSTSTGTIPAGSREGLRQKLLEYAAENPLKLLSITVSVTGGCLLLIFFAQLRFLPDINLENSAALLYAVALLGLFAFVFATLFLLMPGFLIALVMEELVMKGDWQRQLEQRSPPSNQRQRKRSRQLADKVNAQKSVVTLAPAISALAGLGAVGLMSPNTPLQSLGTGVAVAASMTALSVFILWKAPRKKTAIASTAGLSAMLVGILGLLFVTTGPSAAHSHFGQTLGGAFAAVVPMLFCLAFGVALAMNGLKRMWWMALVLGPVLLLQTLMLTGATDGPSRYVVGLLGMGEVDTARVVVTGRACRQVNEGLGMTVCKEVADESPTAICPVTLRSRVGSQVLLEFAPMGWLKQSDQTGMLAWLRRSPEAEGASTSTERFRRIVLEKTEVKAWSPLGTLPDRPDAAKSLWKRMASAAFPAPGQEAELSSALTALCSPWRQASAADRVGKGGAKAGALSGKAESASTKSRER